MLEELNLLSPRSCMISQRLTRILLEGLTPRLKKMKFQIRNMHMDDPMTDQQRQRFWQRRQPRQPRGLLHKDREDNTMD